jgi:ubiquinone/menaquinone biosynthesis C-methylase UbiE
MSGSDEASEYDEMDFSATDRLFAERAAQLAPPGAEIIDIGCGNGKIPLAIAGLVPSGTPIYAVEMSASMLAVAARNRARSGAGPAHFHLIAGDAKRLPFRNASMRLVVSNSLVHHIPEPRDMFREVGRLAGPRGAILIRDLIRPENEADVQKLVAIYASGWSALQTRLFADSLRAALTVDEVRQMLKDTGVTGVTVTQITDRHWSAERPA